MLIHLKGGGGGGGGGERKGFESIHRRRGTGAWRTIDYTQHYSIYSLMILAINLIFKNWHFLIYILKSAPSLFVSIFYSVDWNCCDAKTAAVNWFFLTLNNVSIIYYGHRLLLLLICLQNTKRYFLICMHLRRHITEQQLSILYLRCSFPSSI